MTNCPEAGESFLHLGKNRIIINREKITLNNKNKIIGMFFAIMSAFLFGSAGPVTKIISNFDLTSLQISQIRINLSAIILIIVVLIKYPKQLLVPKSDWLLIVFFGVFAFFLNQTLFTISVSKIPVGITLLLEYLAPVLVILWLTFVRKKRLPYTAWVGAGFILIGLVLVGEVWLGFRLDLIGFCAGLGTAVALAGKYLLIESGLKKFKTIVLSALGAVVGALLLNMMSPVMDIPFYQIMTTAAHVNDISIPLWLLFLWLSVVSTVFAFLLGVHAQKYLQPEFMSQIATLEVVVAGVLAAFILGQHLSFIQIVGAFIMLGGILFAQLLVSKTKE